MAPRIHAARVAVLLLVIACSSDDDGDDDPGPRPPGPSTDVNALANGCFVVDATPPGGREPLWLTGSGESFRFDGISAVNGKPFLLRPAALGTYLLYDADRGYLVDGLARATRLDSDLELVDDSFVSPAEWDVESHAGDATRFQLHHRASGMYLGMTGLVPAAEAAVVTFTPAQGCLAYPELSLDAEGDIGKTTWEDGDVFGFVDTHSHLMTNFGFGGGSIFHGAPFHRLGVEHALPSCERAHGDDGTYDLVGYAFNGLGDLDANRLLSIFLAGRAPVFDHLPDGYPAFTDWPNTWKRSTHQTQYYRWLERAYRGGLRLVVQHATTNSILCELMIGLGAQTVRYSCNDMVAVDRIIEETYNLEGYVDAQSGGPGKGWFRVVKTPAEARAVIEEGKLAVVLGIETSDLFDCFLTPEPGGHRCTDDEVRAKLDVYYDKGVRAMFPVHKFDNGFSAGDGDRNVGQLGSFMNSGYDSNFVTDCPDSDSVFDHGRVLFGGINHPREDYFGPVDHDFSGFPDNPVGTLSPYLGALQEGSLPGDYCQNHGLTPLGETLIREMMLRGMIIEVDHLPKRGYVRAYEMLIEADYPPVGSHGNTNRGVLYDLGGVSKIDLGRCSAPDRAGAMGDGLRNRLALIREHGAYPGEGFGFDLNGFAGGPRPRFGKESVCGDVPQANPVSYPFTSYAGDVTFTQPRLGDRTVDFNTEGMIHLGLLPELIEDARRDGVTDEELESLFRSAEAYLRMWERAEARGAALRAR